LDLTTIALLIISIIGWGFWGFFQKIGVSKIGAEGSLFLHFITATITVIIFLYITQRLQLPNRGGAIYPILGGFCVAIGSFTFLTAIEKTPISIARPFASLNVILNVILGVIFLSENLTIKQYLGIILAFLAAILLSG
jgi:transporter family protein